MSSVQPGSAAARGSSPDEPAEPGVAASADPGGRGGRPGSAVLPATVFNGPVRFVRALPVLPVVLLVGCGVAGTQFNPGVAAQVGDQTITTRHVDEVTANYCTALETVTKG